MQKIKMKSAKSITFKEGCHSSQDKCMKKGRRFVLLPIYYTSTIHRLFGANSTE